MVKRSPHFSGLKESYLFPEIGRKVRSFQTQFPHVHLTSLSVGDTSEPLSPIVVEALKQKAEQLGTREGYSGYGPEEGEAPLREKIASVTYRGKFLAEEIFVSDGAASDIGRLQVLFGPDKSIGVQDPTYPAYIDTGYLSGCKSVTYLPCTPSNGFFPDFSKLPPLDLVFLCYPNNPTGAPASRSQLEEAVKWALNNQAILIYDAAYSCFIKDATFPKTIYEIEGAERCAIEIGSFSKFIGFTGVRLGWTVVPKELKYEEGSSVNRDFYRLVTTFFNGPSNLSQAGALAALSEEGLLQTEKLTQHYRENAALLKKALCEKGWPVYGGESSPYLWVDFGKKNSWDLFQSLLKTTHIVTIPGVGFGPSGEGCLRFSAFGSRSKVLEAIEKIETKWPQDLYA